MADNATVQLTDEQWAFLKAQEEERTRIAAEHRGLTHKALTILIEKLPNLDSASDPVKEKRDWIAGQALAGHLASLAPGSWGSDTALAEDAAKGAYLVADAMLAERDK